MDYSKMEQGVSTLSLTRLEHLATRAETLRTCLRGAFLNDTPRVEATIFEGLTHLLENWMPCFSPFFASELQSSDGTQNIITEYYLQEIFAALLFLADESLLHTSTVSVVDPPRLKISSVPKSEFYVDLYTRQYCAELLLYLCFSQVCRAYRVVQALYPLLISGDSVITSTVSQNHVSEGLFNSPRFLQKKGFISSLLNGVVMTLPGGVVAVLHVLLLDDRVKDGDTADAAKHIAYLFATPLRRAWLLKEGVVTHSDNLKLEEQVRLLSAQFLHLIGCVSESSVTREVKKDVESCLSGFVHQLQHSNEHRLVKPETIEDRLHLGIAVIFNTVLSLPPRGENKAIYDRSYRCFCLYNKYFLTPAFRALTLRSSGMNEVDEVLPALHRLHVLARGSTLGPSTRALLLSLEPVSPGLLDLLAFADSLPAPHRLTLHHLLDALWKMEVQFEEMAHIFVRSVFLPVRGSYVVDNVMAKVLVDSTHASPSLRRMRGLQRLLLHKMTPKDLICKVLMAAAVVCQQRAASANAISVQEKESSHSVAFLYTTEEMEVEGDEGAMLVRMVEGMCVGLGADEVFGTRVTLDRVCNILATVVTISYVCWQWAMLLIPRVLAVDVIHAVFAQYVTTLQRQKAARALLCQVERLLTVVNALHDAAVDVGVEEALAAAIATVQKYDINEEEEGDDDSAAVTECNNVMRAVEESLDAKSTSLLIVHLLALARIAEETAYNFCRNFTPGVKKDADDKKKNYIKKNWMLVQSAFFLLVRVLAEVDDVYAAVTACKAMVWWSLARCDSVDSSFFGRLVVDLLCVEDKSPLSLSHIIPTASATLTTLQLGRVKVRMLDVLLGLCDYDEEGRTLRNIDDYCKRERRCTLFDILVELCGPRNSAVVQVATLHFIGHYVIATYPRVSLSATCTLCVDVFRHTPYEMAKAACASMLSNVAGTLEKMDNGKLLSDVDVHRLLHMAEAMRGYKGVKENDDIHEVVIRRHGNFIKEVLRHQLPFVQET